MQITVQEIAEAAACILRDPEPHAGRTYNVVGPMYTYSDLAAAYSDALERQIECVQVTFEAAEKTFRDKGWPEWQVQGLLEVFRAIDAGVYGYGDADFPVITGHRALRIGEWVQSAKASFL
jgi:uncharacterized protein YbjT (DUF2867 family)